MVFDDVLIVVPCLVFWDCWLVLILNWCLDFCVGLWFSDLLVVRFAVYYLDF